MNTLAHFATALPLTADAATRVITGLVLPYGVTGRTSRGPVAVAAGAIALPDDLKRVKLYRDHRRPDGTGTPVGYVTAADDAANGLTLTFKVGAGADGDLALSDAAEGIRDALSVELSGIKLSSDGTTVVAATLDAVALVAVPAFADARVSSVLAADDPNAEVPADSADPAARLIEIAGQITDVAESLGTATEEEPVMPENAPAAAAQAPAPLAAAAAPAGLHASAVTTPRPLSLQDVYDTLHAVRAGESTLTAALADITRGANPWVSPDGWVGELWSGVAYERVIVPLLNPGKLSNWKLTGWRWVIKPGVDDYAGNKVEIPTGPATTEAVSVEAKRLAGGHDLDRKFWDFNDQEFISSYFQAMAESYAYESDQRAAEFVSLAATAAGSVPASPTALLKAVAKGRTYLKNNARTRATFALVNPADMETLLDVTADNVPAFLSLLGIDPANFVDSEFIPAGTVIVGAKPAATFYELGGSPIRVEAVEIAKGGRDGALFGYYATLLHNAKGIAKVTVTP